MERINDIVGYKNRRIYQDDDCFSFSLDSLVLGNFSTIRKSDNNILVITDIDKVSLEKQGLLIDIIENNHISTVELPKNLKVVLHSNIKCKLNDKIRPLLECYNIDL